MTVSPQIPSEHDQHLLSAYLDGALSSREKAMLEQRLARDPALRAELDHLRDTVALLRDLPRLKAPRDFTLDPQRYARPLPWWKRLFTLEMALQFSGALGAAASLILIVTAVLLTGDSSNDAAKLSDQAQDGQTAPDQSSSQVALQFTATALRRTLTLDDTALAEETAISFAGEEFQSTMAAQSAYYATHQPATATHLPAEAPAPGPMMEADQVESGTFSTESQAEGEVGAAMPSAPLGTEQENTMMQQDEDYAPAEAAGAGGESAAEAPRTVLPEPVRPWNPVWPRPRPDSHRRWPEPLPLPLVTRSGKDLMTRQRPRNCRHSTTSPRSRRPHLKRPQSLPIRPNPHPLRSVGQTRTAKPSRLPTGR